MRDWLRQFLPGHPEPKGIDEHELYFQPGTPAVWVSGIPDVASYIALGGGGPPVSTDHRLAAFLVGYQRIVYLPGPLEAACLVLGLAATVGLGAARRSSRRPECGLLVVAGPVVVLFTFALICFDWRYVLPNLVFLPPAGALAVSMLWPRLSRTPTVHRHAAGGPARDRRPLAHRRPGRRRPDRRDRRRRTLRPAQRCFPPAEHGPSRPPAVGVGRRCVR